MFIESSLYRLKMVKEWRVWVERIARVAKELIPDVEVYVIGSIVRGDYVGGSDVDVLIVSRSIPEKPFERARIKVLIEERLNLPYYHPFELHLLRPGEAELYLKKARGRMVKII